VIDDQVRHYVTERKVEGAANATINRELAALKRGYSLNEREVTVRPKIEMLREDNARQGFFERADFERVRDALPAWVRPLLTVAFITGWRTTSELLPMEWRQVDFEARVLCFEPGMTKNDRGREFPFTDELEVALLDQRAYTEAVQRRRGIIIPHVFHRGDGKPVRYWRRRWLTALLKGWARAAGSRRGWEVQEVREDHPERDRARFPPRRDPRPFARWGVGVGGDATLRTRDSRSVPPLPHRDRERPARCGRQAEHRQFRNGQSFGQSGYRQPFSASRN
jgi:hypothetical protein